MADTTNQTNKPELVPKEAQALKDNQSDKDINSNGNSTHEASSPNTSRNSTTKKSYLGALVKDEPTSPTSVENAKPLESSSSSAEISKEKETTSTTLSTEQISPESKADNQKKTTPNGSINNIMKPSVAPWKKQANTNNRKKRTDGEGEPLTDLAAWPSLDQVKTTEPAKEKKTKEGNEQEPLPPTSEKPEATAEPTSPTESQSRKKGVNWVPLPVEIETQPRQHNTGNRGRGGRGPRRIDGQPGQQQQIPNGNSAANTARSWRSQGQNPNPRGNRRGGRGGYSNGRGYAPPSTVYYPIPLEGESLKEAIQKQVEYYFSVENLCKDMYLRKQMDEEGWVPLSVISQFHRLLSLTTDAKLLAESIEGSALLESKEDKIRRKDDWKTWIPAKTAETAETNNVVQ